MIYGIKQIEKQFPGFEARWCDCQLYDMRDVFCKYNSTAPETRKSIVEFSKYIGHNFADLIKPVSKRMYIVKGVGITDDSRRGMMSTEYAVWFDEYICGLNPAFDTEAAGVLLIKQLYVVDYIHNDNKCVAKRYSNIVITPPAYEANGGYSFMISCFKDADKYCRDIFNVNNKSGATIEALQMITKDDLSVFTPDIKAALFYLNVRNIKQKIAYVSQHRGFYFPKAWGREYKVLSLSQTLTEHSPGPDLPPGYHVRGHFQRGHFKRKPHGVYWWNPHWRGDFSKGIVMKDYKAKGDKDA